jgi:hypothetical protein
MRTPATPRLPLIEPKDDPIDDPLHLGFAQPIKVDAALLQALDAEIRSVFATQRLITPDSVRGKAATLEAAVLAKGWPSVDNARGKVMFVLLDEGAKRDAYRGSEPSLRGRVMFTTSSPGQPDAAVIKLDDPKVDGNRIRDPCARATGAHAGRFRTWLKRGRVTTRREAAFASGAHFVTTDLRRPPAPPAVPVSFAGTYARCNPVTASSRCAGYSASAAVSPFIKA